MKIISSNTFSSFFGRPKKIKFKKARRKRRRKTHAPKSLCHHEIEPSYAAEIVCSNQDLLNQILSKLENKYHPTLKTVCRSWYETITGRKFAYKIPPPSDLLIRRVYRHTKPLHHSMIKYTTVPLNAATSRPRPEIRPFLNVAEANDIDVEANDIDVNEANDIDNGIDVNGILIHQSCNGLLLGPAGISGGENNAIVKHYVYNPTTNERRPIPLPGGRDGEDEDDGDVPIEVTARSLDSSSEDDGDVSVMNLDRSGEDDGDVLTEVTAMNLAFDPSESPHYKIVSLSIVRKIYISYTQIDIYSSETMRWRVSTAELPPHCDHVGFSKGVFPNGAIHWPSQRGETSVCFNVENECFKTMAMPPVQGGQSRRTIRFFGDAGGRLLLIDFHEPYTRNFDVFQLEDYSTWTVRCHVDLSRPIQLDGFPHSVLFSDRFYVLSMFCGRDKDDLSLVIYLPGRDKECKGLITFNLRECNLKKVHSPVPGWWDLRLFEEEGFLVVHPFIRTKFKV